MLVSLFERYYIEEFLSRCTSKRKTVSTGKVTDRIMFGRKIVSVGPEWLSWRN